MSPRSKSANLNASASSWLLQHLAVIASGVTAKLFASDSELNRKYGQRGRIKCLEDTKYHLLHLSEAVAGESGLLFETYVGWAKVMLQSRGVGLADLSKNLDVIAEAIAEHAPRSFRRLLLEPVRTAIAALPSQPDNVPTFIGSSNPLADLANDYLGLLLLLKREEGLSLISRRLESGLTIKNLLEHVLKPVQQEVGRLWQENRITVIQEHYCTAANDILLSGLRHKTRGIHRDVTALAVCAEGEQHCLGLRIFADLLQADGWKVAYAGPNCPISEVLKQISTDHPDLVAISSTTLLSVGRVRELVHKIRTIPGKLQPAILLGGAALGPNPELCKTIGADGCGRSLSDGLHVANRLAARSRKHPRLPFDSSSRS
jgi:methanogenic corrinoid protein MtbC1